MPCVRSGRKKRTPVVSSDTTGEDLCCQRTHTTVQALASQGGEIALDDTFLFDIACSNHLMMSPSFRGSDPYPCGSLTYRTSVFAFVWADSRPSTVYIMPKIHRCQPKALGLLCKIQCRQQISRLSKKHVALTPLPAPAAALSAMPPPAKGHRPRPLRGRPA